MIFASFGDWIRERVPLVIFVVVFGSQLIRGILNARKARQPAPTAKPDETEAQRRAREVRETILRKRAERTGARPVAPAPETATVPPPRVRPEPAQKPAEPLGRTLRRMFEELQREMQPPAVPAPAKPAPPPLPAPVPAASRGAEFERQQQLVDQARTLQESRTLVERRVAHRAADQTAAEQSETGLRTATRGKLLTELRDPEGLRRAFVLREILGTPVGLR